MKMWGGYLISSRNLPFSPLGCFSIVSTTIVQSRLLFQALGFRSVPRLPFHALVVILQLVAALQTCVLGFPIGPASLLSPFGMLLGSFLNSIVLPRLQVNSQTAMSSPGCTVGPLGYYVSPLDSQLYSQIRVLRNPTLWVSPLIRTLRVI